MPVFAVTTARGPQWDPGRDIRTQAGWGPHATYMDGLVEQGVIILGGPIDGEPGEVALLAVQADTAGDVESVWAVDPSVIGGVLEIASIRPWALWLDSRPSAEPAPPARQPAG